MTATPTPPPFDAEAYVEQASRLVGLTIAAPYPPGRRAQHGVDRAHGRLVMSFPLEPAEEPAPVFVPAGAPR